jgi:integrase
MGSIFARGNRLYMHYKTVDGKWKQRCTDFKVGEEKEAQTFLKELERQIEAAVELGEREEGPLTVERYGAKWIAGRRGRTETWKDDEARLKLHVYPVVVDKDTGLTFGKLKLADVRPRHVALVIDAAKTRARAHGNGTLAPRTQSNIFKTMHNMFKHAVSPDEYLMSNPCVLPKELRPSQRDKDPAWRKQAKFEHDEVERLISDERIPEERRALFATLFLGGGPRIGEVIALRVSDYDRTLKPLGRLSYSRSYSHKRHVEKETKTEVEKLSPVHRTLATILDAWIAEGWERLMGRPPRADDLMFPRGPLPTRKNGHHRDHKKELAWLGRYCEMLGLRPRRIHDARRSFISLTQDDGANGDVIRTITHPKDVDVFGSYTTFAWSRVCAEVSKLKIGLKPSSAGSELPAAASVRELPATSLASPASPALQEQAGVQAQAAGREPPGGAVATFGGHAPIAPLMVLSCGSRREGNADGASLGAADPAIKGKLPNPECLPTIAARAGTGHQPAPSSLLAAEAPRSAWLGPGF